MLKINWDEWRNNYDIMTYQEHVIFYDNVYSLYPNQKHVHKDYVKSFLSSFISNTSSIIEIGGWDGDLAVDMLSFFRLNNNWINFDICRQAIFNSKKHSNYCGLHPSDWVWDIPLPKSDLCILAHVLEHMRLSQITLLIRKLLSIGVKSFYIECPIKDEPINWLGRENSHIIECGWIKLNEILMEFGLKFYKVDTIIRFYYL